MRAGIKGIIIDVDGVIVGDKPSYNFPDPHPAVLAKLKAIHASGAPITLCTAKPAFSIENIIEAAGLDNPHITNGGAVIIDPIDHRIVVEHTIDRQLVQAVTEFALERNLYLEFYTSEDCFILSAHESELTRRHAEVERRYPKLIDDVEAFVAQEDIVKIFLIAKDEQQKLLINGEFAECFSNEVTLSWTIHPALRPCHLGVVTAQGVSKAHGAQEIAKSTGIDLTNTLGIGDTLHDWQFMELCGYVAAMGNGSDELKRLVIAKDDNSFIGGSVDENGILDIFDHFGLN